ncbi:antibiotic biosynthesis monooxygenase family protein [Flavicella marina]|uniref:antibiotic biosynthesis monooxygenase family protein n=1 Tax=Flavicella marina TaxID=1475951 RepID=UPI0012654E28|nr:antibiotic biosynthesis monooxygenase [Flavicella marina]
MIAETLNTPYYAVIFTSILTDTTEGYGDMASRMEVLVNKQKGFLGFESAREELGITVSYWESLEAIKKWKEEEEHSVARNKGRDLWYKSFKVRICKVEKDYGFGL